MPKLNMKRMLGWKLRSLRELKALLIIFLGPWKALLVRLLVKKDKMKSLMISLTWTKRQYPWSKIPRVIFANKRNLIRLPFSDPICHKCMVITNPQRCTPSPKNLLTSKDQLLNNKTFRTMNNFEGDTLTASKLIWQLSR